MQRPDQLAGSGEFRIELGRGFQGVGHVGIGVDRIRHAARLTFIEAPGFARCRPQIQRAERVDALGVRNRFDRSEDPLRLFDPRAVIRFDAL